MIRIRLIPILFLIIFGFFSSEVHPQGEISHAPGPVEGEPAGARLRVVFAGDIMGHGTQIASALATGEPGYDYHPCFEYLKPYLEDADIAVGNLEVTLAGPPYKGYPQFSSPDELADALKDAGFDILIMANNHALDRGQEGFERTIEQLDRRGILHTGTFTSPGERQLHYPLVVEKNGIRIALLNYTYGTNGLRVPPPSMVNRIDTIQILEDLQKAASAEPDFIFAAMHWGTEYELTENRQQRELAEFLFRNGADAVIGSHPHVVQPIRGSGKGDLVAYSVGNFISNQRPRYRDGGIVIQLDLVRGKDGAAIEGHAYLPSWVWKPVTTKGTRFTLVPANLDPSKLTDLPMTAGDRTRMLQFLMDTRANLEGRAEVQPDWIE